jgi:hypothetical protein
MRGVACGCGNRGGLWYISDIADFSDFPMDFPMDFP